MLLPVFEVRIDLVKALQNFHLGIYGKAEATEELKNLMMVCKLRTADHFTDLITPE